MAHGGVGGKLGKKVAKDVGMFSFISVKGKLPKSP